VGLVFVAPGAALNATRSNARLSERRPAGRTAHVRDREGAAPHGPLIDPHRELVAVDLGVQAHASQQPKFDLESSRDLARAMGRISGFQFAESYEVLRMRI